MKPQRVFSSLVLIVLCLGFSTAHAQAGGTHAVDGANKGYRMNVSSEWKEIASDQGVDKTIQMDNPYCTFIVMTMGEPPEKTISDEVLQQFIDTIAKNFTAPTTVAKKIEPFLGNSSAWFEMKGPISKDNPMVMHQRYQIVVKGNELYGFIVTSQEGLWEKTRPHWGAVLSGFQFLDAVAPVATTTPVTTAPAATSATGTPAPLTSPAPTTGDQQKSNSYNF